MAIISKNKSDEKEKIKADINSEVLSEIKQYCAWASVDDIGFFIEEAARFVFDKDKDWKTHKKEMKRNQDS